MVAKMMATEGPMATQHKQMSPVEFWISLFPQAPLFGVEWQFARLFPTMPWFNAADVTAKVARASVDEAVKATEEVVESVVHLQEQIVPDTAMTAANLAPTVADEPTEPEEASVGETESAGVPPATLFDIAPVERDDLKQLKGVGPKLETMLNEMGIYRFDQIAAFTPDNLAWVDANLTSFKGRAMREDWVAQAKALL
jgi:predicted flap endonuclease-1-like 5' DNA nuclease